MSVYLNAFGLKCNQIEVLKLDKKNPIKQMAQNIYFFLTVIQ